MSNDAQIGVLVEGTIGDSLILVPTLSMLASHFRDSEIYLISFTNANALSAESILRATFPSFRFSVINNSAERSFFRRLSSWLKLASLARDQKLDSLVYAFRPENQHASKRAKWHRLIVTLCVPAQRYGFDVSAWPLPSINKSPINKSPKNKSRSENLISKLLFDRVATSLGVEKEFSKFGHKIKLVEDDIKIANTWLQTQFEVEPKNYYVVCVSGKTKAQRWPLVRYIEVITELSKLYSLAPVFVGSAAEVDLHRQVIAELGFGYTAAGLAIGQTGAVMQRAQFYLGNDTGPMHLAAALNVQCLVIQSSRNLAGTWDPLGEKHIIHRSEPDCVGCGLASCKLPKQICLTSITVEQVLSSCERLQLSKRYLADPKI